MNTLNTSSLESRKALTQGTNFIISSILSKLNGSTKNRRQQVLLPYMKDWVKKCRNYFKRLRDCLLFGWFCIQK